MRELIDRLNADKTLSLGQWTRLLSQWGGDDARYAAELARGITRDLFGNRVYFRGIIEFTNVCKNGCYYCGLRCGNAEAVRYRLTEEEILACCRDGYALGFRTFVLQGGEDPYWDDDRLCGLVSAIGRLWPDAAVTLSVGERSRESYARLRDVGAARYLLRHETASPQLYAKLHPGDMSFDNRMRCLRDLRELGYQTGCGMMVGAPYQTAADLALDMDFLCRFRPHMIGIGPFLPQHATPFAGFAPGSAELTVFILSLCRIMRPEVLLPATTALDSCGAEGRKKALLAGANVVMPNLSPSAVRQNYLLYDGKPGLGQDARESFESLKKQVESIGCEMVTSRGDYKELEAQYGT